MDNTIISPSSDSDYIGDVIRILDRYTLIINVGKAVLSVGDKIQIYENCGHLENPDGSFLCDFCYIKDELEVVQTELKYSICKKPLVIKHTPAFSFALSPLHEQTFRERDPLPVAEEDIKPLSPSNSIIRIGDSVKLA